jgi:hypothetical protein
MLIRTWIRTAAHWQGPTAAQVPNAVHWQVPTATEVPTAAQVPTTARVPTAAQVPNAAQEDLDNESEMWNMYLEEVKEEDNRITDAWKEDASSIVVFVSLSLLIPCSSQ